MWLLIESTIIDFVTDIIGNLIEKLFNKRL